MDTPKPVRLTGPMAALATLVVAVLAAAPTASASPTVGAAQTAAGIAAEHHGDNDRDNGKYDRGDKKAGTAATCTLRVPTHPLTAAGLATPYRLAGDGCHEANGERAAFAEAAIYDPTANAVTVYRPLVIDAGTTPAAPPTPVALPPRAVVGLWFGFQGDTLKLTGPGADRCVNGLGHSLFGQFSYCNAPAFFAAARRVVTPALGVGTDGLPCPTTRDFGVVDQDQSDNVVTNYVLTADGRVAQDTPANRALGRVINNGSDEGLLVRKIDPALGCTPPTAPDLTQGGAAMVGSLALNELSAAQHQAAPVALVPPNDPMTMVDGHPSRVKTALYRLGVDQPVWVGRDSAATYCRNLMDIAPKRLAADKAQFTASTSPDPAMNLYDFLNGRLMASLQILKCPA